MNSEALAEAIFGRQIPMRDSPRPLPEAQIMELRAAVERYEKDCPFKVGDLVKPRANAPYIKDDGLFIVAEVFRTSPVREAHSSNGNWSYYGKLDMRVIKIGFNGDTVPNMVESWLFEPYTGEGATAQEEPAGSPVTEEEIRATDALVDADDWIAWAGGVRHDAYPVKPIELVEIEFRNGVTAVGPAEDYDWEHDGKQSDIMRYRVIF